MQGQALLGTPVRVNAFIWLSSVTDGRLWEGWPTSMPLCSPFLGPGLPNIVPQSPPSPSHPQDLPPCVLGHALCASVSHM